MTRLSRPNNIVNEFIAKPDVDGLYFEPWVKLFKNKAIRTYVHIHMYSPDWNKEM